MKYALMEATSKRTYKCPYCTQRFIREKLVTHIDDKHHDLIPEGFTALRVAYNYINDTTGRKCVICGKPTAWNEMKGRYERLCSEECKKAYLARTKANYQRKYGTDKPTSNPELNAQIQRKALANRKIAGMYKFSDGGEVGYVGAYEKKFLEFMDKIMKINSEDLQEPGPDIVYQYNGENHLYIPDYYYIPYNLIIEIKRGGEKNPDIYEYKEKTVAKEEAVRKLNKYNYLRLTNNDFAQVMSMFGLLKYDFDEKSNEKTMRIYESTLYDTNHTQKERLNLSSFKRLKLSKEVVDKYKPKAKYLKHTLISDSCEGYLYIDKEDNPVCVLNVNTDKEYIQQIEISKEYQSHGLSTQMLDICVNELGAKELSVSKTNTVAINIYKKYGFVIYDETDKMWLMKLKKYMNETVMSGTIAAALAPSPLPSFADKNNYYIIQHMKNNVYDYSITKDPMQYSMFSIDPEKGYKIYKSDKGKIEKTYLTFKMKDSKKAKEVYDEVVNMYRHGKCADCSDYIYYKYTGGNHILDENQLMFDDRFELIKNFFEGIQSMEEALYNYLTPSKLDILEEQVDELGGIIYGRDK